MDELSFDEYILQCIRKLKIADKYRDFIKCGKIFACSKINKLFLNDNNFYYTQNPASFNNCEDIEFYKLGNIVLNEKYDAGYCIKPYIYI